MAHEALSPAANWTPEVLHEDRITALVQELTPAAEVRQGREYGVHIVDGFDPQAAIGRHVEAAVFAEFFDHSLQEMAAEYASFDAASTFLLVVDYARSRPVGVMRLITESENGFKSLHDLTAISPDNPWYQSGDTIATRLAEMAADPARLVDIGTMAVMPEYRSNHDTAGASAALYSTCVRWSLTTDHTDWLTIVDKNIYDMMQAWGEPFTEFDHAPLAPYLSSPASIPAYLELRSGLEQVKAFDTGIHALYTQAAGLETQFVLPTFPDAVQ